ncbi:MAG: HAMP domain-containing histidine kinase [Deltaproteobacteria bacterium]|nr:HAMP domain-containing histidine kinase [Deltaproteobacteria bacterium]
MSRSINSIFRQNYYKLQVITCVIIFLLFFGASYVNIVQSLDSQKETAKGLIDKNWSQLLTVRLMGDDESLKLVFDELNENDQQIRFFFSKTRPGHKLLSYVYKISYADSDYGYVIYSISLKSILVSRLLWLFGLLILGGLFVYLFYWYYTNILNRSIIVPLENLFNKISSGSFVEQYDTPNQDCADCKEITSIDLAIKDLCKNIVEKTGQIATLEKSAVIARLASQVAHDIRSPLSALNVILHGLSTLPEEKRIQIRGAVQRIDDITRDLVAKNTVESNDPSQNDELAETHSVQLLSGLIDALLSEKRIQYLNLRGINIESRLNQDSYGLFASVQGIEFKRVLSNLVNNAVEAVGDLGNVIIGLGKAGDRYIEITIKDDGKGIPADVLPRLTKNGETHNKEGGSGLGLYHAKKSVESWGGQLEIESTVNRGTTVTIQLPKNKEPDWFVPFIVIKNKTRIVVLDDDNSIHRVWQDRLISSGIKQERVIHLMSPDEMITWFKKQKHPKAFFYLCDFEFIGSDKNGLQVIKELGIASRSILVTSRFEEPRVRDECARLKVKLLPKNLAGFVPINPAIQKTERSKTNDDADFIVIDNDPIVHETWASAAILNNKKILSYSKITDFFKDCAHINKDIPVYIDSDLGDNNRGELIAKDIKKKGFDRIYLSTGYDAADFGDMPWITGVVDKIPPFIKS